MDFFEAQARAKARTTWLLVLYLASLGAVSLAMALAAGLVYTPMAMFGLLPVGGGVELDFSRMIGTFFKVLTKGVPRELYVLTMAGTLFVMVIASLHRWFQLREGGFAVAELMRAEQVTRSNATVAQTRLLNVVEEMSIAAGISVPAVFVLPGEKGINAMAAGYGPNEAVVILTDGAFASLSRDELQAVMGHEYSHILNGDMRLNVQLMALLHGVDFIGTTGAQMVRESVSGSINVAREKQTLAIGPLFVGAILAVVGSAGLFCARAIKAAISRQREHLADASAVRFTRHGEAAAGALDTILATKRGSIVWNPHAEDVSHMFYAQAINVWMGPLFATHPYIEDRIRSVDPGFRRTEYRRKRGTDTSPADRAVAVISGGEVVQVHDPLGAGARSAPLVAAAGAAALIAAVGRPAPEHLDAARRLLGAVPQELCARLGDAEGAAQVLCALVLDADMVARERGLSVIAERRGKEWATAVRSAWSGASKLGRGYMLPLAELALPALKAQKKQELRDAFLADHLAVMEVDKRVTLREFVLHAFLRQHLREDAGRPVRSVYKSVEEVKADAHVVLSMIAHAGGGENATVAFDAGKRWLGVELEAPIPVGELSTRRVGDALEKLRQLQALEKPRILKACSDAVDADKTLKLAEVELLRLVAATLDCPLPPMLATLDPTKLAA